MEYGIDVLLCVLHTPTPPFPFGAGIVPRWIPNKRLLAALRAGSLNPSFPHSRVCVAGNDSGSIPALEPCQKFLISLVVRCSLPLWLFPFFFLPLSLRFSWCLSSELNSELCSFPVSCYSTAGSAGRSRIPASFSWETSPCGW